MKYNILPYFFINHDLTAAIYKLLLLFIILYCMKYWWLVFFSGIISFASAQDTTDVTIPVQAVSEDTLPQEVSAPVFQETASVVDSVSVLAANLPTEPKKRFERVRIFIGMNYAYYHPIAVEKDEFTGPYYPVKDSTPVWTSRNTTSKLNKDYPVRNFQLYLQANFWKGLFIGMNYQFFTIKNYKKDPNLGNLLSRNNTMFFIVSAKFGYVFEFLKNKCLQLEPSLRLGGYTADDYYDSGKGRKFSLGADVKLRYLIKRKFAFSLGVDYDYLRYKKKGYSDIFGLNTYQKTTMSAVQLNVGIGYNITIRPQK